MIKNNQDQDLKKFEDEIFEILSTTYWQLQETKHMLCSEKQERKLQAMYELGELANDIYHFMNSYFPEWHAIDRND